MILADIGVVHHPSNGPSTMGDLDLLQGVWNVAVMHWKWEYTFASDKRVTWRDLNSHERGSGNWNSSASLINIWWNGSSVRESWRRPLTRSTRNTWYESSYFRGPYLIEKILPFELKPPGEIYQSGLLCWAAGASSWLEGMNRPRKSIDDLVRAYKDKLDSQNSLLEKNITTVFSHLGIEVTKMSAARFTWEFLLNKLKAKGHVLLMSQSGGDMGHTYVVYGVGEPSKEYFSVFNPLRGSGGFDYMKFADLRGIIYVGWAR
jgi:hypothetical protein